MLGRDVAQSELGLAALVGLSTLSLAWMSALAGLSLVILQDLFPFFPALRGAFFDLMVNVRPFLCLQSLLFLNRQSILQTNQGVRAPTFRIKCCCLHLLFASLVRIPLLVSLHG